MSDRSDKVSGLAVRFARSATKHRVSKQSIRHVITHATVRFEQPPPEGGAAPRSTRLVYIGEGPHGDALEVMAVQERDGELLVIHAMPLRPRYRRHFEEPER